MNIEDFYLSYYYLGFITSLFTMLSPYQYEERDLEAVSDNGVFILAVLDGPQLDDPVLTCKNTHKYDHKNQRKHIHTSIRDTYKHNQEHTYIVASMHPFIHIYIPGNGTEENRTVS